MNRFAYRVYYEYNGPSAKAPLRSSKEPHEISEALRNFPNELPHYLCDENATVFCDPTKQDANSINVVVETILDEIAMNEAVQRCLDNFHLLGVKL